MSYRTCKFLWARKNIPLAEGLIKATERGLDLTNLGQVAHRHVCWGLVMLYLAHCKTFTCAHVAKPHSNVSAHSSSSKLAATADSWWKAEAEIQEPQALGAERQANRKKRDNHLRRVSRSRRRDSRSGLAADLGRVSGGVDPWRFRFFGDSARLRAIQA